MFRFSTSPFAPRQRVAIAASLAVLVAACGGGEGSEGGATLREGLPATSSSSSTTVVAFDESDLELGFRSEVLIDTKRQTDEVVQNEVVVLEANDERRIDVDLLYPSAEAAEDADPAPVAPRPLIVWLNGLGGRSGLGNPVPYALGQAGFIVVIANSPELSSPVGDARGFRFGPGDVSSLLDALADPADGFADDLAESIDIDRVGIAAHSIGATTAFGLAFHECCRDDRVDAVTAFGASVLFRFDDTDLDGERDKPEEDFSFGGTPLLLIVGTEDAVVPDGHTEEILAQTGPTGRLLLVDGADHFELANGDADSPKVISGVEATVAFFGVHVAGTEPPTILDDLGLVEGGGPSGSEQNPGE